MDLGRVNSELNLSQRETDEKNRLLQVRMIMIYYETLMKQKWPKAKIQIQETLSELATLRSTLADSDEVNPLIIIVLIIRFAIIKNHLNPMITIAIILLQIISIVIIVIVLIRFANMK